jgi:hypothetical protein
MTGSVRVFPTHFSSSLLVAMGVSLVTGLQIIPAAAQTNAPVSYTMSIAGLPIGSATLTLKPNGKTTELTLAGSAGGPIEIGRISARAVVAPGQVTAESQSGSGSSASSATLTSRGQPGNSTFSYSGVSAKGQASVAMILTGSKTTKLDVVMPDAGQVTRSPVTEAHKTGVIDPLSVLAQAIEPGGGFRPGGLCGKTHQVFNGVSRFSLSGSALETAKPKNLPEGWSAVTCRVTYTPIAGFRTDKKVAGAQARTATLTFAIAPEDKRSVLWAASAPGPFGNFALTAKP